MTDYDAPPDDVEDAGTQLPHNVTYEREILGSAIVNAEALDIVTGQLRPEHFFSDANRALFTVLVNAHTESKMIDAGLLIRHLTRETNPVLPSHLNVPEYIAGLIQQRCVTATIPERIKDIVACFDARTVHHVAQTMVLSALDTKGDPERVENLLADATENLASLTEGIVEQPWLSMRDVIESATTADQNKPIFTSGLKDLDVVLNGGFREQQLVVIAARPGEGKTTVALNFARAASINAKLPGLFISMEMSGSELGRRIVSAEGRISHTALTKNELTQQEASAAQKTINKIAEAPLWTVVPSAAHWPTIRALITSAHRRLGIKYVVIDYLQLIESDGKDDHSRQELVARVSRNAKRLAMSLNIVVFMVCQLNRGPENRANKKPVMSDIRESGQIEQDADVIILLSHDAQEEPGARVGEEDMDVVKHRGGETRCVSVAWQPHYSRVEDMWREGGTSNTGDGGRNFTEHMNPDSFGNAVHGGTNGSWN